MTPYDIGSNWLRKNDNSCFFSKRFTSGPKVEFLFDIPNIDRSNSFISPKPEILQRAAAQMQAAALHVISSSGGHHWNFCTRDPVVPGVVLK